MLVFEEQKLRLEGLHSELIDLKDALALDKVKAEIAELETAAAAENFAEGSS